jgi:hypothetical protein
MRFGAPGLVLLLSAGQMACSSGPGAPQTPISVTDGGQGGGSRETYSPAPTDCGNAIPLELGPGQATELTAAQWFDGQPGRFRLEAVTARLEQRAPGTEDLIFVAATSVSGSGAADGQLGFHQRVLCRQIRPHLGVSIYPSFPLVLSRQDGSYSVELRSRFAATSKGASSSVETLDKKGTWNEYSQHLLEAPAVQRDIRIYRISSERIEVRVRYLGLSGAEGELTDGYRSAIYVLDPAG